MSPPDVPGVPGTKLPPIRSEDDLHEREKLVREMVTRKRESLRAVRKNSPPEGTPKSTREEGALLIEIAEDEEELRQLARARRNVRRREEETFTQLRPPAEVVQAPAPAPAPAQPAEKPPANLAWLTYVIPPIVTGVAAILGANYIKKEDFDTALKAQVEATATLTKQLGDERAARLKLEQCLKEHVIPQGKQFQVVTLAGLRKLGIEVSGQNEDVKKVDWNSKALGDPNAGKLPSWSPKDADDEEIQVKAVNCASSPPTP